MLSSLAHHCVQYSLKHLNTSECPLSSPTNFVEIINESTNSTPLGSILHFRCKSDLVSNVQLAVCTKDGQWFPNPEKYTCDRDGNSFVLKIKVYTS